MTDRRAVDGATCREVDHIGLARVAAQDEQLRAGRQPLQKARPCACEQDTDDGERLRVGHRQRVVSLVGDVDKTVAWTGVDQVASGAANRSGRDASAIRRRGNRNRK